MHYLDVVQQRSSVVSQRYSLRIKRPSTRIIIVRIPTAGTKYQLPLPVIGEVTISVAIKNTPNINPPVTMWNMGLQIVQDQQAKGWLQKRAPEPKKLTGICHVITFL